MMKEGDYSLHLDLRDWRGRHFEDWTTEELNALLHTNIVDMTIRELIATYGEGDGS